MTAAIDLELAEFINNLEKTVNERIDKLIILRDNANGEDKYLYRYLTRKMENIIGEVHRMQDKMSVEFKL